MSKSHLKTHLIFYGATILVVLGLFRLTSAYGESNLKAPPNLNGRYLSTAALPGCPETSRIAVTIQQSGVYLNGALELQQEGTKPPPLQPEYLTLNGRWQQQLTLLGQTNALTTCQNNLAQANIALQGTITQDPEAVLNGQLSINQAQPWQFTAKREALPKQEVAH